MHHWSWIFVLSLNACVTTGVVSSIDDEPIDTGLIEPGLQVDEVRVEPALFLMGCTPSAQLDCGEDERPVHLVSLSHSLSVMQTEVTQALYRTLTNSNPAFYASCGEDCPVERVDWVGALSFANRLSEAWGLEPCYQLEGAVAWRGGLACEGWRLPTEAEWEYLARGGEAYAFAGSDMASDVAWLSPEASETTRPVGTKAPNGYGLYDMSGNVWEWTWDAYEPVYQQGVSYDPTGPSEGSDRVVRGGSFFDSDESRDARVSNRQFTFPENASRAVGFRLVRTVR